MKVGELIDKLTKLNLRDAEVIISSDGEGNNFSPFTDFSTGVYDTEERAFYDDSWTAKDAMMEEDEWVSFIEDNPMAVVFWP